MDTFHSKYLPLAKKIVSQSLRGRSSHFLHTENPYEDRLLVNGIIILKRSNN